MKTATGIFSSRRAAAEALARLQSAGFDDDQLCLLTPEEHGSQPLDRADCVTTAEGEQPGMGKVIGGVVGGAIGASGGLPLGTMISAALFPGVGPVLAFGFITAAITGAVGVAGGAAAGGALENLLTHGLPRDELYFYQDALSNDRTILILRTADQEQLDSGKQLLTDAGAESIDAAREKWWIGLRDAEAAEYDPPENFSRVESNYRRGFEAALDLPNRSKNYEEAEHYLAQHFPDSYQAAEFRAGYQRGHDHAQKG